MTDLKIPVRRVRVELCLAGQPARKVELFLGEREGDPGKRDDVLDLLEGERQFLPCRDAELGIRTIINRDHIVWLAIPPARERTGLSDELGPLYDHRHRVKLTLERDIILDGAILFSAPVEHARLVDHVNQTGAFLVLHWSDQVLLVRKSAIVEIVEASALGAPESR